MWIIVLLTVMGVGMGAAEHGDMHISNTRSSRQVASAAIRTRSLRGGRWEPFDLESLEVQPYVAQEASSMHALPSPEPGASPSGTLPPPAPETSSSPTPPSPAPETTSSPALPSPTPDTSSSPAPVLDASQLASQRLFAAILRYNSAIAKVKSANAAAAALLRDSSQELYLALEAAAPYQPQVSRLLDEAMGNGLELPHSTPMGWGASGHRHASGLSQQLAHTPDIASVAAESAAPRKLHRRMLL